MIYIPAIIIGLIVGAATKYVMPHKYLSLAANTVCAMIGGVLSVVLVSIAQPEDTDVVANLLILSALGGSLLAVLGANWCYELVAEDNPRQNPRVYSSDGPRTRPIVKARIQH